MSRSTISSTAFRAPGVKVFHGAIEFFDDGINQRIVVLHGALKQADNVKLVSAGPRQDLVCGAFGAG